MLPADVGGYESAGSFFGNKKSTRDDPRPVCSPQKAQLEEQDPMLAGGRSRDFMTKPFSPVALTETLDTVDGDGGPLFKGSRRERRESMVSKLLDEGRPGG